MAPYPMVVTTMVAWGDMDANRHVNNVIYFRYIEHARLQYFSEWAFPQMQQGKAASGQSWPGPIAAFASR